MRQNRTANQGNQTSSGDFESDVGGRADSSGKQKGQTATPGLRPTSPGQSGDQSPPWEEATEPEQPASPSSSGKGAGCLGVAGGVTLAIVALVLIVAR